MFHEEEMPLVVVCAVLETSGYNDPVGTCIAELTFMLAAAMLETVTVALASTVNPVTPSACSCSTPEPSAVCTSPVVDVLLALIMFAIVYVVNDPDVLKV